jgi:hypothetical protein
MFCGTLAVAINRDRLCPRKGHGQMLALAGAVSFLLALIWQLGEIGDPGDNINYFFWIALGLLLVALHLGGVGGRRP